MWWLPLGVSSRGGGGGWVNTPPPHRMDLVTGIPPNKGPGARDIHPERTWVQKYQPHGKDMGPEIPTHFSVDRQTPVKTLPSTNFVKSSGLGLRVQ